jgi:ACS family hexuronate transporter-like MFS transporter
MRRLRWWIAGLLAVATALSYLDRQSFPLVVSEIRKDIPITNEEFARLGTLFLLAYGLMYAGGGKILDALGTRAGYTVMILVWSAANLCTGLATSVRGFEVFRFLLGMGEGGGFPASGKAVSEWFPPKERSFAFGLFNTGSAVGAVVAAPLLAWIALAAGWRWVFIVTGAAGFVWAAVWLLLYQPPSRSRLLTDAERAYLEAGMPPHREQGPRIRWIDLFRYREVWGLMLAKLLTDSVWFFLIFWLPKYLADARGFDTKQIGAYAWIPFLFAGLGSFLGGGLGTLLIARGASVDRARKTALGLAAAIMPAAVLVVPSPVAFAIVFYSACLFAHQFWSANVQTLAADLFPSRVVGSVEGLLGSAGALGAAGFSELVGRWVGSGRGFTAPFLLSGVFHAASFGILLLLVRRIQPLAPPGSASPAPPAAA